MKVINIPRIYGGFLDRLGSIFVIVLVIAGLAGCAEPDEIGLSLIPDRATFNSVDTLTIHAYSDRMGNIATNFSSQNILGVMNDPVFGKVKAEMFVEFRLPENMFSLGTNPILDSAVLYLAYAGGYYGQITSFQALSIYELSESFPEKDTLLSDLFIPHYPDPIGQRLLRPAPLDSVPIDTIPTAPHFSVRLSDAFGQKIIDANGTEAFENIPNFLEYFKGLYISIDDELSGFGSVFNINMYSFYTRLSLYFHEEGEETPLRHNFFVSEFSKRSGYFKDFGFEGANQFLLNQLNAQNPTAFGDSLLFVQSMGKLHSRITFPFLSSLKEKPNVVINRASLVLPVANDYSDELFPVPNRLLLYRFDSEGRRRIITDMNYGEEYYGGLYNENRGDFRFNITNYLQELLDGKITDDGLVLFSMFNANSAERVVIKGPGDSSNPMRLEIVYTVFE